MPTPKIARFFMSLHGNTTGETRLYTKTEICDPQVTVSRANVVGIPCFLESQLAFLPDDLKNTVINAVAGIVETEKLISQLSPPAEDSVGSMYLPPMADIAIELHAAARGPVATVDLKLRRQIDKSAAMSMALIESVRQATRLKEKDEVIRLLVLLDIGSRMWTVKKPSKMLYLSGASVYNRPNWGEFPKIILQTDWAKYVDLFPDSFDKFLYLQESKTG